jgi:hypothetical protein
MWWIEERRCGPPHRLPPTTYLVHAASVQLVDHLPTGILDDAVEPAPIGQTAFAWLEVEGSDIAWIMDGSRLGRSTRSIECLILCDGTM